MKLSTKVTIASFAAVSAGYLATSMLAQAKPMAGGAPGSFKQFHVKGQHQCQSTENMGYMCDVETRDALDCTSGHERLQMMNCCHFYNGKMQQDARSIRYQPGSCSAFN